MMDTRLTEIREYIIKKMHGAAQGDKIGSTEQLLNFAKAFEAISTPQVIIPAERENKTDRI